MKEKQCPTCGKMFVGELTTKVFCNRKCKEKYHKANGAYITKHDRTCDECGKDITDTNRKNFCSNKCKDTQYRRNHKDKISSKHKEWREQNPDKVRVNAQRTLDKNREVVATRRSAKFKENYRNNPDFLIGRKMRSFIERTLGSKKEDKTFNYLTYTTKELKEHLESLWEEGMSWENYGQRGKGVWNIEHIRPLCSYNFINEDGSINIELVREANSLENLKPMLASENYSKGNKWDGKLWKEGKVTGVV